LPEPSVEVDEIKMAVLELYSSMVTPAMPPLAGQFVTASLAEQTWPLRLAGAGVGVGDAVGVGDGVGVGEAVGVGVADGVGVGVGEAEGVGVGEAVGVAEAVGVGVGWPCGISL
jgi:hypothetical protein